MKAPGISVSGPAVVLAGFFCLLGFARVQAESYFVSTNGLDSPDRDGKSIQAAWASLAYACETVPVGSHTIRVGPGNFEVSRTAVLKTGFNIVGQPWGSGTPTRLVAAKTWKLGAGDDPGGACEDYLVCAQKVKDVSVQDVELASPKDHRIVGGLYCRDGQNIRVERVTFSDFSWNGLRLEHASQVKVGHCRFYNASTDKFRFHGGAIRSRWLKDSEIHHNEVISDVGHGYGYKGGGHENVRFHHNRFEVSGEFAFESAHENEYGVEISNSFFNRCISIPKSGQAEDPNKRGYACSFWVHHNVMTDSYTIEGPRNHLRLSHNYILIEKPGGRVYTHHGGVNHGPVWIHHNVVENVDRALVWMNQGLAEGIQVYNNTVFAADAGNRAGILLDSYQADRLKDWVVVNNIFVAPESQPRRLIQMERGVPERMVVTNNLCLNFSAVPAGNIQGAAPGLNRRGERPWPFYAPETSSSVVVDRGANLNFPYSGAAPDLGAYEFGQKPETAPGP